MKINRQEAKISDISRIQVGYQIRTRISESKDGTHRLVQVRDFDVLGQLSDSQLRFTPAENEKTDKYTIQPGNLLFVAKGQSNRSYFISFIEKNAIAGNSFYILTPNHEIHGEYLNWWLNSEMAQDYFEKNISGSTIPFISVGTLSEFKIPVPDISLQAKIVKAQALLAQEMSLKNKIAERKKCIVDEICKRTSQGTMNQI